MEDLLANISPKYSCFVECNNKYGLTFLVSYIFAYTTEHLCNELCFLKTRYWVGAYPIGKAELKIHPGTSNRVR